MKIVLINQEDGTEIVQTVGLEAMGDDSEFGLRSDKLQLMAGTYQIIGFYLYKADGTTQDLKQILSGEPDKKTIFDCSKWWVSCTRHTGESSESRDSEIYYN